MLYSFLHIVAPVSDDNGGALVYFVDHQIVIGGQLFQSQSLFSGKVVAFECGVLLLSFQFGYFAFHCLEGILEYSRTQLCSLCVRCVCILYGRFPVQVRFVIWATLFWWVDHSGEFSSGFQFERVEISEDFGGACIGGGGNKGQASVEQEYLCTGELCAGEVDNVEDCTF